MSAHEPAASSMALSRQGSSYQAPTVSVNICCYNSERYIEETLESVCRQTYRDWELIVVDDGSSDGTERIVRRYQDQGWPLIYHRQANAGLPRARNTALTLSSGKYIAFLDHDDEWLPDRLAVQVPVLESRPEVAVVFGDAATIDGQGAVLAPRQVGFHAADGDVFLDLLTHRFFINWQTVIIRRSALDEVGHFRPYRIAEDYDILVRCAARYACVGVDCVVAKSRWHARNTMPRHVATLAFEMLHIASHWIDDLPERYAAQPHAIRSVIPDIYYRLGRQLCSTGQTRAGRAYLRAAWRDSTHRRKAVLFWLVARLLGGSPYHHLVRVKRYLLGRPFMRLAAP